MAMDGVQILSAIIGWTYMILWTASFYPQVILNIRRKTTEGFSINFSILNILGMTSYAVHNCVLSYSPTVRHQYAQRNPHNPIPTVQLNDVVYAIHGAVIVFVIYTQFYPRIWRFTPSKAQRASPIYLCIFWLCITAIAFGAMAVVVYPNSQKWMWLDVIYLLGSVKAFSTLVKYLPQAWLNYRRKSTQGLSMLQFTLDFTGALLSLLQLVIDSIHGGDWSGVLGNPAKFALGNVTLFFDLVFYFQHYYLYREVVVDNVHSRPGSSHLPPGETDPLLQRSPSSGV
ncbi:hypothetical protein E8E14_000334 [Neopestalotiopsis sp. 37M]|nr:hypothetical protein E8E14_000334 [Neopestalotiopsis sp. 37M]